MGLAGMTKDPRESAVPLEHRGQLSGSWAGSSSMFPALAIV